MKSRAFVTVAALALVMLAGSQAAYAQEQYDFKIPFDFVANGKAFTAGTYYLIPNQDRNVLTLQSMDANSGTVMLPVETRLAERKLMTEPEVVFDKVAGKLYISELLVPGSDGYLVLVTKATHSHESLKGARKKG